MARTVIRNAQRVYTFDDTDSVLSGVDLVIEHDRIASIGTPYEASGAERVIDASQHLVLPGLVNTHHHFFQHTARAMPTTFGSTIIDWLTDCYVLWAGLDPEAVYWSTQAAVAELLLSGCTTAADFAYLHPNGQTELFDEEVRAVREMGIRFHGVRGCTPTLEEPVAANLAAAGVDPQPVPRDRRRDLLALAEGDRELPRPGTPRDGPSRSRADADALPPSRLHA